MIRFHSLILALMAGITLDSNLVTLVAGPIISFAVSALKGWKPIKDHPKTTAFIASAAVGAVTSLHGSVSGVPVADMVTQILIPFAGAVATHEAVTDQIKKVGSF